MTLDWADEVHCCVLCVLLPYWCLIALNAELHALRASFCARPPPKKMMVAR